MKKITIGNHLTPYLLAVCAVLGGILTLQSHNVVQTQESSSPTGQTEVDPLMRKKFTAPSVATFSEIVERPLFIAGRTPPAIPEPKPKAAVRLTPLQLILEGVVISPKEKVAVMVDTSNREVLHLTIGMKHRDWELTTISDTAVTFKRGNQSQELTLEE